MMMSPARKPPDTSTYSGRFAVRLRMLREKAGLTPEQVAEAVGVSVKSIYNWEQAVRTPPFDSLPLLSDALGVKVRTVLPDA